MTTDVVIDASAAVEMVTRTTTGAQLQLLLPPHAVPWVPDGLFDAEVISVLRRWELRSTLSPADVAAAFQRLAGCRLRRATVSGLATQAWTMRHNITLWAGLDHARELPESAPRTDDGHAEPDPAQRASW